MAEKMMGPKLKKNMNKIGDMAQKLGLKLYSVKKTENNIYAQKFLGLLDFRHK